MSIDFLSVLTDSSRWTAESALIAVGDDPDNFRELLEFCFTSQYPFSMRAARVIQLHCALRPESFAPCLEEYLPRIMASETEGVKRNFLKILAHFVDISLIKEPGLLIGFCFDQITDRNTNPAIKIYSIDIVERFAKKETDLLFELHACLEFILPESPPSLKSKANKILRTNKRIS